MSTVPADTFRRSQPGVPAVPSAQRLDGRLKDLLAGKKIVMTGVTGFIGEQLLWKILTELPDTTPSVLVRRKGSAGARDRVISLVKKAIFAEVREAAGGAAELVDARIEVIEGDLPNVPDLPADLDVLVHCAGDVSFDPPDRPGLHHQRDRHQGADGPDARGGHRRRRPADQGAALRPHLHRVHRRPASRRHPRGAARAQHRLRGRDLGRAGMRDLIEAESRTSERLTTLRKQAER